MQVDFTAMAGTAGLCKLQLTCFMRRRVRRPDDVEATIIRWKLIKGIRSSHVALAF